MWREDPRYDRQFFLSFFLVSWFARLVLVAASFPSTCAYFCPGLFFFFPFFMFFLVFVKTLRIFIFLLYSFLIIIFIGGASIVKRLSFIFLFIFLREKTSCARLKRDVFFQSTFARSRLTLKNSAFFFHVFLLCRGCHGWKSMKGNANQRASFVC